MALSGAEVWNIIMFLRLMLVLLVVRAAFQISTPCQHRNRHASYWSATLERIRGTSWHAVKLAVYWHAVSSCWAIFS